mgnify:CR=1 FL=1
MRRWALLFSLLAVLTGAPLRQAEAASDLVRTFMGVVPEGAVEVPDGGVGDDADVGTLVVPHGHAVDVSADVSFSFHILPPPCTFHATPAAEEGLWERVWWPQSPPSARFAWLQAFRF